MRDGEGFVVVDVFVVRLLSVVYEVGLFIFLYKFCGRVKDEDSEDEKYSELDFVDDRGVFIYFF